MNSNDTSKQTERASSAGDHNQPGKLVAAVFRLLRYLNTRTLALLMFLAFAFLNTMHGSDAQTNKPAAGVSKTELVTHGRDEFSPVVPLILWQFTRRIVQAFTAAVNDPSLVEYAKQQGTDTPDLQTTPCQGAERKTSTY